MNYEIKEFTNVFVKTKDNKQILLGFKNRGFGVNKWNGFGGKIEEGETPDSAARREVDEECSLSVENLKRIGIFISEGLLGRSNEGRKIFGKVHIFTTNEYSGELTESDEMRPQWFDIQAIPYNNMWPDAKHWYDYVLNQLNDKYFVYYVKYDERENISRQDIDEVDSNDLDRKCLEILEANAQ